MPADERANEGADGHDAESPRADVVECATDEPRRDPGAFELLVDLGMHQDERSGLDAVADDPGDTAVDERLVAELPRFVPDDRLAHLATVASALRRRLPDVDVALC